MTYTGGVLHMMVLWVDKLVALATFHPLNLVFWCPQALVKRNLSTTASQVIAVVEGDPSCAQGPWAPLGHFKEALQPRTSATC